MRQEHTCIVLDFPLSNEDIQGLVRSGMIQTRKRVSGVFELDIESIALNVPGDKCVITAPNGRTWEQPLRAKADFIGTESEFQTWRDDPVRYDEWNLPAAVPLTRVSSFANLVTQSRPVQHVMKHPIAYTVGTAAAIGIGAAAYFGGLL